MHSAEKIKIGVIIPTRGERPLFLENALRLLKRQSIKPDLIKVVDYPPESNQCDITQRYRRAYTEIGDKVDVIFLWEDDDWYRHDYFETVLFEWQKAGCPELFGTDYTIYYHIKLFGRFTMYHDTRSSAMSTLIKAGLQFNWPPDYEAFTDTHLWLVASKPTGELLTKALFNPKEILCLGIKHGVGMTGGDSHINRVHHYYGDRGTNDAEKSFLRMVCDKESVEFYSNYFT